MSSLAIYLTFDGRCEEAFGFYRSVFGGEFTDLVRFSEMPEEIRAGMEGVDARHIMHVGLPVGQGSILMGSDGGGCGPEAYRQGNHFSVSVAPDSREQADALHAALAEGGQVSMPMGDAFWGGYFGMLTDRFGIQWMINLDQNSA